MQVAPELIVVKMTSLEESNLYSEKTGMTYRVVGGRLGTLSDGQVRKPKTSSSAKDPCFES